MTHGLKILPQYFVDISNGIKKFEVRKNDRPFAVGDHLALTEYDPDGGYTGRCMIVEVTYILNDPNFCKEEYIVMGIKRITNHISYTERQSVHGHKRGIQMNNKENKSKNPVRYYVDGEPFVQIEGIEIRSHVIVDELARLDRQDKYIIPHLESENERLKKLMKEKIDELDQINKRVSLEPFSGRIYLK